MYLVHTIQLQLQKAKRIMYWGSILKLVASCGLLVIISYNNTKMNIFEKREEQLKWRKHPKIGGKSLVDITIEDN